MIKDFQRLQILPVVSIDDADDSDQLADALAAGGLPAAEITLRTAEGARAIAKLADREGFLVGAGTVHSVDQAKQVADAGARFVVMPGINVKTVQWCLDQGIAVIPGVASPTDLEIALEMGLSLVKFFPAEALGGVAMLKALQGPYGGMRFMPTGGISVGNLKDYLSLPSVVACGGSWIAARDLISDKRFDEITTRAADAVALREPPHRDA